MAAELESKSYDELDRLANAEFSKYKREFEDKIKTDNKKIETFNIIWAKVLRQQFTVHQGVGNLGPHVIINNNNQPQPPRPQVEIDAQRFTEAFQGRRDRNILPPATNEKKNRLKLPSMGVPKFLTGKIQNVNPLRQDKKNQEEKEKKRRENEENVRNQQSGDQSSSNESDRGRIKGSNEGDDDDDDDEDDDIIDVDDEQNKAQKIKQKPQKNKEEEEEEEENIVIGEEEEGETINERKIDGKKLDEYFLNKFYGSSSVGQDLKKNILLLVCKMVIKIGNYESNEIRLKLANKKKVDNTTKFDGKAAKDLFLNNCVAIKKEIESVQKATKNDKSLKVEIEITFEKELFYCLCARYQFQYDEGKDEENEYNLLKNLNLMSDNEIMSAFEDLRKPAKIDYKGRN